MSIERFDEFSEPKDPSPYDGDMPLEDDDRPDMNDLNPDPEDGEEEELDLPELEEEDVDELDFDDDEERFDRAAGDAGPDE